MPVPAAEVFQPPKVYPDLVKVPTPGKTTGELSVVYVSEVTFEELRCALPVPPLVL